MNYAAVLDKGFIHLEALHGDDLLVANVARSCYGKSDPIVRETARALLKKLVSSSPRHETPFEFVSMRWHVKCPIFVARQWMRHRIGSYMEKSLRYTISEREYYLPDGFVPSLREQYIESCESAFDLYDIMLSSGVRPELARTVLPLSTYTAFRWQVNLRAFVNWYILRSDKHAQEEHRAYAHAAWKILESKLPDTCRAIADGWLASEPGQGYDEETTTERG